MSKPLSVLQKLYWKIDPPRIPAIAFFCVYISTTIAGLVACFNLPTMMIESLGTTLVTIFGVFIFGGSLLAGFGVLPGIHWLERGGILFIGTAVIMYSVMLISTTATTIALWLVFPLIFTLAQRFFQITFGEQT